MTEKKNTLLNIYQTAKAWLKTRKIKCTLKILTMAFITSFWIFLITGTESLSVVYLFISAFTLTADCLITNKISVNNAIKTNVQKKIAMAVFVLTSVVAFVVSLKLTDELFTLTSTLVWIVLYIKYKTSKSMKELAIGTVIPFAIIMYSEYLQNNLGRAWSLMADSYITKKIGYLIGISFVIFVSSLLNNLFNNKRIGYYATGIAFGLLAIINFFVYAYTEQPFTISDLKIATTAAGVLKTQGLESEDWLKFAVGIVLLALYFVIITVTYKNRPIYKKKRWRVVFISLLCALGIGLYSASSILSSYMLLYQGHIKYGFVGNFYITINNSIKIPKNASDYVIEDISDDGSYKPNVIIIMNEAFSDLEKTFDLTLNEDPIPFFHGLQENYPHGITYSSVKGNNTCSSEWELLSGSPTALTAKGAMIYRDNDKPMRSIVNLFNNRGYTTVGMHPYYKIGYNRNSIYQNFGFKHTSFMEDMPSDLDTHRNYITDKENYKEIIKVYEANEKAGNNPFFCFNITMQNHGNYITTQSNDIYTTNEASFADVNTYLSGLKHSDVALEMLITYFEKVEEDTIILFFGDHQPMVDNAFYEEVFNKPFEELTLEELTKVYEIPYLIWANYDLNKEAAPKKTSNCYLTNILFEVGNLPKSTWLDMVSEYQENYPVITELFTIDSQNTIQSTDALLKTKKEDTNDLINLYQKYSYGILYGLKE